MKKFQLFFLAFFITTISVQAVADQLEKETNKQQHAALQASCTINILKTKLQHANAQTNENEEQFSSRLKNLYEQCTTIINPDGQPHINQEAWSNENKRQVAVLQKNHETRNCFNQAINNLQQLSTVTAQEEKDLYIKNFFEETNNCSNQHAQRISIDHLEAQIERWKKNKEKQEADFKIWLILIKHTPNEKDDLEQELQKLYDEKPQNITFDEFAYNIRNFIKKIQANPSKRACFEKIINFKNMYDDAPTRQDQENLKSYFAPFYMQCANQ